VAKVKPQAAKAHGAQVYQGKSLEQVDRLPEWPSIVGFPMDKLGNFMKTLTRQSREIVASRRGPLRIIDGANITKEIMRARNPSLRANPIITPEDLTVFEEIEIYLNFDFLVVNASIISQNSPTTPLPPYINRLMKEGRLLQISCSTSQCKQKADDYLCIYLALAFDGIVITGDMHREKEFRPLVEKIRYGRIEEDSKHGFGLVMRKDARLPGILLAEADRGRGRGGGGGE
jgi:hypothetical protein